MENYYLAVDIGASSGRHILGYLEDGYLKTEEVHRFYNGLSERNGEACWDIEKLFEEIIIGMKKCKEIGKTPISIGIDTWAVDFVLLDASGHLLGNAVGYRDKRTAGMDEVVYQTISEQELYQRTGIQKQIFNTIYQLIALREKQPKYLTQAESLLLIPDYFHYLLTGKLGCEYTNATTTQLVSPETKDWDWELIQRLSLPEKMFKPIIPAGTSLGVLTETVQKQVGFNCEVVLPATHDTGSAVLAIPSEEEYSMYISSGTWSLMGVEQANADCSEKSRFYNLTNEGGYGYRFRYLKNIMGLWMIQCLKKELEEVYHEEYTYNKLCQLAEKSIIHSLVDCYDNRFLAPESMSTAIQNYCKEHEQQVPKSTGELARVIYQSLAACYGKAAKELEELTGKTYPCLYIVGGGANAEYLNELTAQATGKKVYAGPIEATAAGNLMVQMMYKKEFADLKEARKTVAHSFDISVWNNKKQ